jgi:alginate O-acetyltransferase complex protein AlgI
VGIGANVGLLVFYKLLITYGTGIFLGLAQLFPQSLNQWLLSLTFPLGLSYISLQVISYLIDVRTGTIEPEQSLVSFAFYILMFPKLLVGPIVRYSAVAQQLEQPTISPDEIAYGVRRFIIGFAKKVLIADVLAKVVNSVFVLPIASLGPQAAWLALISYGLQIYYDFSGYSDMAIGLASMMGVRFGENFNYPYIAQSIGEFWRRWHISLSSWFRDYVFYPLERRRLPMIGRALNIMVVFLLTGLWHGLTVSYIAWGLLHGALLAIETLFLNKWLKIVARPIRHLYLISALLLTWLIFRAPDLSYAAGFLRRLSGDSSGLAALPFIETTPLPFIEPSFLLALGVGVLFALPLYPLIQRLHLHPAGGYSLPQMALIVTSDLILLGLFVLSVGMMAASRFLPGIYGGF